MKPNELIEDIDIIFEKEINDTRKFGKQFYFVEGKEGGKSEIVYKNADILVDLFSNIQENKKLKSVFIGNFFELVKESPEDYVINDKNITILSKLPLGFYVLIKLGYTDKAIELYKLKSSPISIISILPEVIKTGDFYFTNSQLGYLKDIVRCVSLNPKMHYYNIEAVQEQLFTKLVNMRFSNVQKKIKGVNLEINQDRKEVSNIINYLEFDKRYNILLNDIDKYINAEASDATSAAMIGNLRNFLCDLIIDLAKRISKDTDEEIPHEENRSEIGDARVFLKDKLKLHDKDDKLINDFVNILHEQGGHSFISSKKYFRLTRNMVIEIVLFLLSKYKEIYNK